MKDLKLPLGQNTGYPQMYSPDVLCPLSRADSRSSLGLPAKLPFSGVDIWNAWELTWLEQGKRPAVAIAEIRVPADSPNIIESKSLKLYLNSFSMSQFSSASQVAETIAKDLDTCTGSRTAVRIVPIAGSESHRVSRLAGTCLDAIPVTCTDWDVNADLLTSDSRTIVEEDLYTHLLRSLCPVTSQPDNGSLQISYKGPKIDRASLLRYIVSYREHRDFHESCVERMFTDFLSRCEPERLSLHARYSRRGGIDINPYRSNTGGRPLNLRLWRQ